MWCHLMDMILYVSHNEGSDIDAPSLGAVGLRYKRQCEWDCNIVIVICINCGLSALSGD